MTPVADIMNHGVELILRVCIVGKLVSKGRSLCFLSIWNPGYNMTWHGFDQEDVMKPHGRGALQALQLRPGMLTC